MLVDWKVSGCFTFGPKDAKVKTEVTHVGGTTVKLSKEDEFDSEKSWEIIDNWCKLRAHLKVGKATIQIMEFFHQPWQDGIQRDWANNKDYIQKHANEQNAALEPGGGSAASSVPSASSVAEESPAIAAPAPKRKAPPAKPGRSVARRTT